MNRRNNILIQIIILVISCILIAWFIMSISGTSPDWIPHVVTYRVTSTDGKARIAYTKSNGERSDLTLESTPWEKSLIFQNATVYLLVGNPVERGKITCEILMDGKSLSNESATYPDDKIACALFVP